MIKNATAFLAVIFITFFTFIDSFAQVTLVQYSFTGETVSPTTLSSVLSASDFQVSEQSISFGTTGVWAGSGVPYAQSSGSSGSWARENINDAKFFSFTLSTDGAESFDLSAIQFQFATTGVGAPRITVQINGVNVYSEQTSSSSLIETVDVDLTGLYIEEESVEVKIIGWENVSEGDRDVSGNGDVRINDVTLLGELPGEVPPTISSLSLSNINSVSADVSATVDNDGGDSVTDRGFVYSESKVNSTPTIDDENSTKIQVGNDVGEFSTNLSLQEGTRYAVRAYAENSIGVTYTDVEIFTTIAELSNEGYTQDFSEFISVESLPGSWYLDGEYTYEGEFGSGATGGLRGDGVLGFQLNTSGPNSQYEATLTLENSTGSTIENLNLSYLGRVERLTVDRPNELTVLVDGVEIDELSYSTQGRLDNWVQTSVTGLNIPNGETFDIVWTTENDPAESGTNVQNGITDVSVQAFSGDPIHQTRLTGDEGFRLITAPTNTTYSDLFDNIWTQGVPNSNAPSDDVNIWTLDGINWVPISNLDDPVEAGSGVLIYVFSDDDFDGNPDGFPKTLSLQGVENTAGVTPILNTNDEEFTLVGNPFASPISWDGVEKSGDIEDVIYLLDSNGNYISYAEGTGDIVDGILRPFQGFLVEKSEVVTVTPEITFVEESKTKNGVFYGKDTDLDSIIRFNVDGEGRSNSMWLRFSDEGSFERISGDALQLESFSSEYVILSSQKSNGNLYDIGHFPIPDESVQIPISVESSHSGSFKLSVTDFDISNSTDLYFVDTSNNVEILIDENFEYEFTIYKAFKINPERLLKSPLNPIAAKTQSEPRFYIKGSLEQERNSQQLPESIALNQNYPNPFNPTTTISYQIPETSNVLLEVYDMLGRQIGTLVNGQVSAGSHQVTFDATNLSSGIYIYRLTAGNTVIDRKLTIVK